MMVGGYRFFGTEVQNPDLAAVVDVATDSNALSMPPKTTFAEIKGFACNDPDGLRRQVGRGGRSASDNLRDVAAVV